MKLFPKTLLTLFLFIQYFMGHSQNREVFKPIEVYKSKDLIITQITENSFEHTSFLQTNDFGNVPCNGLVVRNGNEAIVFDTPTNNNNSEELIKWAEDRLGCKITAVIPTHFHNDCLGGLQAFHNKGIASYAYFKTVELAKINGFTVPENSFKDKLILKIGGKHITAKYFGEGHTKDNVVGYFPAEGVMFGGCLIKELDAGKGYLGDSNVNEWSNTVKKIKKEYPKVRVVIPGHGDRGNKDLLDYTINLFKKS